MGRTARVSMMAIDTSDTEEWNQLARSLSTKTRIKKSKASSIQLEKLAKATCFCVALQSKGVFMSGVLVITTGYGGRVSRI